MHLFHEAAQGAAQHLKSAGEVLVVSHIDADGLCSAAIATRALGSASVEHEVRFVKSLGGDAVQELIKEGHGTVWFVDLGSGMANELAETSWVIADHHAPQGRGPQHHVNPHFYGIDGSREVSGAGVTWAIARSLVDEEVSSSLAALAVVGAVGDLQQRDSRKLTGVNRELVAHAADGGNMAPLRDVTLFGRETRPLVRFFQYADDPSIPGVSGSSTGAIQFLAEHKVARRGETGERSWVHLDDLERQRLATGAVRRVLAGGGGGQAARRLFGEVYELPRETRGTPLHDAKEFATLLNSTARYGRSDVGLALVLGDRAAALEEAAELAAGHRRALVDGVEHVLRTGLERKGVIQYFHGGDRIRDTIVGIVAGMVMRRDAASDERIMVGFANAEPGFVKVSCRAPRPMTVRGVDLAEAVAEAARESGGEGGGHKGAAGATIPVGAEPNFVAHLDVAVRRQTGRLF